MLKKALAEASAFTGAATQIRTGDLILTKDALYLLSYSSIFDSFDIIARKFPCVNYFFSKTATFFATKNVWARSREFDCSAPKVDTMIIT